MQLLWLDIKFKLEFFSTEQLACQTSILSLKEWSASFITKKQKLADLDLVTFQLNQVNKEKKTLKESFHFNSH